MELEEKKDGLISPEDSFLQDDEANLYKPIHISIKDNVSSPKLRRAFIFAEDRDWDKADEYLETVLDNEPENAYAYLGKLLVEQHVESIDKLSNMIDAVVNSRHYNKALRYSEGDLKCFLEDLGKQQKKNGKGFVEGKKEEPAINQTGTVDRREDTKVREDILSNSSKEMSSTENLEGDAKKLGSEQNNKPKEQNLNINLGQETKAYKEKKKSHKGKVVLLIVLSLALALVAGGVWWSLYLGWYTIEKRDLNTLNTIPDLFEMPITSTYNEVIAVLDENSFDYFPSLDDDSLIGKEPIRICGMKTTIIRFFFEDMKFAGAGVVFEAESYSLDRVVTQYEKYYGEYSRDDYFDAWWDGEKYSVGIHDNDDVIQVIYIVNEGRNPLGKTDTAEEILPEIDSLGLIPYLGCHINRVIGGLIEHEDYEKEIHIIDLEDFQDDSFTTYTLNYYCSLFGINREDIYPEVIADYDTNVITCVQYKFYLDNEHASVNVFLYLEVIDDYLMDICGKETTREWHDRSNPLVSSTITYNQMYSDIITDMREGMYVVQWDCSPYVVSLTFEFRPGYEYSIGTVAITIPK